MRVATQQRRLTDVPRLSLRHSAGAKIEVLSCRRVREERTAKRDRFAATTRRLSPTPVECNVLCVNYALYE